MERPMEWIALKIQIETLTGLHRDALHVYAGLIGVILAAAVLRRTVASPWPWLLVLIVECSNEFWDIFADGLVEQWEIDGTTHDLWNTMLAASILPLLSRFASSLLTNQVPDPAQPGQA